ncbi:MAG: hypothetical protein IH588_10365 [Anaerolineales bacterium]|nr:hypothetical protein [Anaerolineales bacterium]
MTEGNSKFIKSFSMIERKAEIFLSQVIVPLWILTFYFFSLSKIFPAGINNVFVTRSGTYTLWVTIVLTLIFSVMLATKKGKILFLENSKKGIFQGRVVLLLLPLTPVAQYILSNRRLLSVLEAIYLFAVFAVIAALFVLVIPNLFKRIGSSQILVFLGLALTFSVINMASISSQFSWHEKGSLKIQLVIFVGVFFISWLCYYFEKQNILYNIIAIFFLSTCVSQLLRVNKYSNESGSYETDNKLLNLVYLSEPQTTPNIYILIYDAYVVNETMLSYGIDNSDQERYLEELGFKIYRQNYSLASDSIGTMSRVLNASTEFYGVRQKGCAGDGLALDLLKEYGYKTYGIFPAGFCFRGYGSAYDYSVPNEESPANLLIAGIMMGEFNFDIGFSRVSNELFSEEKAKAFTESTSYSKFLYAHSLFPGHSQNSGQCLPDNRDTEIFAERLQEANLMMKEDLNLLLESDSNAIIIVAGDHGPYLTKNCYGTGPGWVKGTSFSPYDISEINRLDIQDRYGSFLAIRWPTQDFEKYDDITVLQDLFPVIFAYMFQDLELLEAKVEPVTLDNSVISEAKVVDGVIEGGINSGEPLFVGDQ